MNTVLTVKSGTRRFLQLRRHGLVEVGEVAPLLHPDVRYRDQRDAHRLHIEGRAAVAHTLVEMVHRRPAGAAVTVLRHAVTGTTTALGHWRIDLLDGRTVHCRDHYTVRDGLIADIDVERHVDIVLPPAVHSNMLAAPPRGSSDAVTVDMLAAPPRGSSDAVTADWLPRSSALTGLRASAASRRASCGS